MKYIVIEIQKAADGSVAIPAPTTYDNLFDALSRYHTILASAAISAVPVHTACVLNEVGQQIRLDSFNHVDEQPVE